MKGKVFFENFNFLKNYFFCTFNAVKFESIVLVCKLFYAVNVNEPYSAYFGDIFVNVGRYGMQDRIRLVESDLWAGVAGLSYDLIVSNPPYVDAESVAALPDEYLKEPELALGSGDDGLEATRRILEEAAAHLNPFGVLVVEIGHNRDVLEMQYPQLPFTWLETSGGDGFVFLLTREELVEAGFGD